MHQVVHLCPALACPFLLLNLNNLFAEHDCPRATKRRRLTRLPSEAAFQVSVDADRISCAASV